MNFKSINKPKVAVFTAISTIVMSILMWAFGTWNKYMFVFSILIIPFIAIMKGLTAKKSFRNGLENDILDEKSVQPIEELVKEAEQKIEDEKAKQVNVNEFEEVFSDNRSRTQKIYDYMKDNESIDSETCKKVFGYNRLSDVISELRKRGVDISIEKFPEFNSDGSKNHPNKRKYILNES